MNNNRFCQSMLVLVGLVVLATARPVRAQSTEGAIVSATLGATAMQSETALSFSVAGGYRLNRTFGLGVEFVSVPEIGSDDDIFLALVRPVDFRDAEGELMVFTTNVRLEVPTTARRFVPYAVAGGGVANLKRSYGAIILPTRSNVPTFLPDVATLVPSVPPLLPTTIYPPPSSYRLSTTALALTLGGGVSVLAGEHLSIDVDLRYLRLVDVPDYNIGRFGAGASYRF